MLPLYEMLARNGQAMEAFARQFGLSAEQTREAMAALMPAFSEGLKRNAADPWGVGAFLAALSTGQHARYFEDAGRAFSPEGMAEGNGILGHIFGSKELSRAVAAQAAQATGIGQEIMKQMLPAMAATIMGGLYKQATGQAAAMPGFGTGANPLQQIMEQMMRQGMGAGMSMPRPEAPQPGMNPFDNPFGKVLEGMFGGGASQRESPPQAPQGPFDNPLGKIFEEMMRGGPRAPEHQPSPRARANPSGRPRNPYDDLFGDLFEAGAKSREDYQKNMKSIFDQFLEGMDSKR